MTRAEFKAYCNAYSEDFICLNEPSGNIIFVSENVENVIGFKPNELEGINPYDYVHPEDKEFVHKYGHLPVLEGSGEERTRYRFQRKGGAYIWLLTKTLSIKDDDGNVEKLISVSRDSTEYVEVKDELKKKEKLLEKGSALGKIGVWEVESASQKFTANRLLGEILETGNVIPPEDHGSALQYCLDQDRPIIKNAIDNAIIYGEGFEVTFRLFSLNGNIKWVKAIGQPEQYLGKVKKVFGVFQDITQQVNYHEHQKMLMDQLTNQKKQLEEFNYIFTHNLRSPVANLSILIDFLKKANDQKETDQWIEKLEQLATQLNHSLEDLVNTVKSIYNKEIGTETVDINDVMEKSCAQLRGRIEELDSQIETDFRGWQKIEYPRIYMESIFLNLLGNALKYASPDRKPEIKITALYENERKVLQFADNGLGIDLEKYGDKIFKMNKTFHNHHKEGKGLGLFMTKNQIEAMGGEISVNSEVNKGTTFTINFNQ